MTPVDRFGIHMQDNLIFLHEQGGGRCLNPGLAGLDSPFQVKLRAPHWDRCPHQLPDLIQGRGFNHPLVRAMGANQAGDVFWVRPADAHWIWKLSTMTGAAQRNVAPYWSQRRPNLERLRDAIQLTDVAPLCLIDIEVSHLDEIERLMQLPRTRNLVLSGPVRLPGTQLLNSVGLPDHMVWSDEGGRQLYERIRECM